MNATEASVVVIALLCGTIAAIFNHLTPELGLLIGGTLGYAGKGIAVAVPTGTKEAPWKSAPDE